MHFEVERHRAIVHDFYRHLLRAPRYYSTRLTTFATTRNFVGVDIQFNYIELTFNVNVLHFRFSAR